MDGVGLVFSRVDRGRRWTGRTGEIWVAQAMEKQRPVQRAGSSLKLTSNSSTDRRCRLVSPSLSTGSLFRYLSLPRQLALFSLLAYLCSAALSLAARSSGGKAGRGILRGVNRDGTCMSGLEDVR